MRHARLGRAAGACLAALIAACASTAPAPAPAAHAPQPQPPPHEPRTAPEPPRPLDLRVPVDGVWIVSQGYHGTESHHGRAAYALDLVKIDDEGRAYARRGRRLSDWYGFGADVLASADGVVVHAIDHFPDNRVWSQGGATNSVIVRHGDVYSEYVHLQRGSLRVRAGDRVTRGQALARCGNSGAETPHLHWALLSSIDPIRTQPAAFTHYEERDAAGAWRAASGIPKAGVAVRHPRR